MTSVCKRGGILTWSVECWTVGSALMSWTQNTTQSICSTAMATRTCQQLFVNNLLPFNHVFPYRIKQKPAEYAACVWQRPRDCSSAVFNPNLWCYTCMGARAWKYPESNQAFEKTLLYKIDYMPEYMFLTGQFDMALKQDQHLIRTGIKTGLEFRSILSARD